MCNPSLASLIFTIASFSTIPTLLYHSPASPAKESHSSLPTRHMRLLLHLRKHLPLCPYSRIGFQTAQLSSRLMPPTRECHGFCCGFLWGTGMGWEFRTPKK